jgi:hypothetical protein
MMYRKVMAFRFKYDIKHVNILCGMRDIDFHRDVDVICALLECYANSNNNSVPTFRDNILFAPKRL